MVTFYPFVDHAVPDVSGLSACEQFPRPAPPVKINGVLLVGDMTSEQLHLASADDMKTAQDAIGEIVGTVTEQGEAIAQLAESKQDKLSDEQITNIAAVPDKADDDDLPYALVEIQPTGDAFKLQDRAVNLVSPTVTATTEWTWADGETGTPVFSNGYWTVQNASFAYDGPVAGSATDTEITFAKTDTKSFYFAMTDYDYETYEPVFVFNVGGEGGEEVRAKCKWSDEFYSNVVESLEYDGVKYVFEYPITEYDTGNTYSGTGTVAEHVASLVTTYGPTITLTMPQTITGHVRDLIVRIDLLQEAGAPPVAFAGGTFETADGEMPELVKGINLLSFTETDEGVFGVAFKEMKQISAQGGS